MRRKDELLKACLNSTVLLKPLMLFTRSPNATISFIFQITSQLINPANKTLNYDIKSLYCEHGKKSISGNSLTGSAHYCANRSFGSESKAKAIKRSQSF